MPCKSISFLKKVGLSVFCSFIFWSCENDIKDIKALTEKKGSVETIIDVQSFYSQQAKMKAKLTAPLLMKYNQVDTPSKFNTYFKITGMPVFFDSSVHKKPNFSKVISN